MKPERKGWLIPTGVGVASFVAGIAVGYFLFRKRLKNRSAEIEQLESEQIELGYEKENNLREVNKVLQQTAHVAKELKENGQDLLNRLGQVPVEQAVVDHHPSNHKKETTTLEVVPNEEETQAVNVFRDDDEDWSYDEELKTRSPDRPYIIHRDEYFSNEMDFSQTSLMFYKGDEVLCDENDVPIYNPDKIVGKLEFGHGSRDPHIVYIRNEKLQAEWEVLLDYGYYQTEVLGEQVEHDIKHSRGVLKFRQE